MQADNLNSTCDPYAFLGKWATTSSFLLDNQAYSTTYGNYSGWASNVPNYCTGGLFSSPTAAGAGGYPWCYGCNLVLDMLYTAYQCGDYKIIGWNYACNDSFYGYVYRNYLGSGWQQITTDTWYKVAASLSVSARDVSGYGGLTTQVAPSGVPPTTYVVPVKDRDGHNWPITVFDLTITAPVATSIKIETFYDGSMAGHAHSGRPLHDFDLHANQLGALFAGPEKSGGLVGTAMTFRLAAGASRTISYQTTGFAGTETVRFTYNDNLPAFRSSYDWNLIAKTNYLEALPYGPYWINYGETPSHPNNHYGTGGSIAS